MKFTPKTEEEVSQYKTWENGIYSFEILGHAKFGQKEYRTCDTQSKAGKDMIVLVVQVYNDNGASQVLIDYITEEADRKLRHVAVVSGLLTRYQDGDLNAEDFIGKAGKLKLYTQKGKPKEDGTGNWPDKNAIDDYIVEEEDAPQVNGAAPVVAAGGGVMDDTIPFMRHMGSL